MKRENIYIEMMIDAFCLAIAYTVLVLNTGRWGD